MNGILFLDLVLQFILVSSWVSSGLSNMSLLRLHVLICRVMHCPQRHIGRMLVVWLCDRLPEEVVCRTRDKYEGLVAELVKTYE